MGSVTSLQNYQHRSYSCLIGFDPDRKEDVSLGDMERRGGLYVLGMPRFGKTTLLLHLALQDIQHGHGLLFIDPHGEAIDDLLKRIPSHRAKDVIVFDPASDPYYIGINPLFCSDPTNMNILTEAYSRVYNLFYKAWEKNWGVWLEKILRNALYVFLENQGYTLVDLYPFLVNRDFRHDLLERVKINRFVSDFWYEEFDHLSWQEKERQVQHALTRIQELLVHPPLRYIVGQQKSTLNLSAMMEQQKILLVRIPRGWAEDMKSFLGLLVLHELTVASQARGSIPPLQRKQFSVFVDEFQNFATPDFARFFTEAGKLAIAPVVAHQERRGQFVGNKDLQERVLGATMGSVRTENSEGRGRAEDSHL